MRWGILQEIKITHASASVDGNEAIVLEFRSKPGIFLFTDPRFEIPRLSPTVAVVNEQNDTCIYYFRSELPFYFIVRVAK